MRWLCVALLAILLLVLLANLFLGSSSPLFAVASWLQPENTPSMAPSFTPPPTKPKALDPVHQFVCMEDSPVFWDLRRERSNSFRNKYCNYEQMDIYLEEEAMKTVPIMFIFWIRNSHSLDEAQFRLLSATVNTAAQFNDEVILLVFGNSRALNVTFLPNVVVRDVTYKYDPLRAAFDSFGPPLYQHYSSNEYYYELFCFQRWFAGLKYLEMHNYDRVFFADNDVLLLTNVTADAERCYRGCRNFGLLVYAMYFRIDALREYIDYLKNFYLGKTNATVEYLLNKEPVVSDMFLHTEYYLEHYANRRFEGDRVCLDVMSPKQKPNLAPVRPYDGGFYEFPGYFQDELQMNYVNIEGRETEFEPYMLQCMHFQGWRKKKLQQCPKMMTTTSGSTDGQ